LIFVEGPKSKSNADIAVPDEREEDEAVRLRQNLARDYGCKVLFVGDPVLGIRIPRDRACKITQEDMTRIKTVLEVNIRALRIDEIERAYILADRTYLEMEPAQLKYLIGSETIRHDEEHPLKGGEDVGGIISEFAKSETRKAKGFLATGRRAEVLTQGKRGRYVRFRSPHETVKDVAVAPTIRSAAAHSNGKKVVVRRDDLKEKIRRRRVASFIGIVLDTSHSMELCAEATKRVVIELLKDAYQRRDKVALISCSGRRAQVVLPFTSAVVTAKRHLDGIEYGGTTPLAHGLITSLDLLEREIKKEPSATSIVVLITDGSANVPLEVAGDVRCELERIARDLEGRGIHLLVVDVAPERSDLALAISRASCGKYVKTSRPSEEEIFAAIRKGQIDATSRSEHSRSSFSL